MSQATLRALRACVVLSKHKTHPDTPFSTPRSRHGGSTTPPSPFHPPPYLTLGFSTTRRTLMPLLRPASAITTLWRLRNGQLTSPLDPTVTSTETVEKNIISSAFSCLGFGLGIFEFNGTTRILLPSTSASLPGSPPCRRAFHPFVLGVLGMRFLPGEGRMS
ncbi:hypothetical protein CLAIMM_14503 [Cladophialophora immunda]|nr:hypothetical protein CLAIMM_14503 [Cladophialophora immunda]